MSSQRPFYLNLLQIRLPIGGWVSILHRGSGALLSVAAPFLLYGLMLSLRSAEDFARVKELLSSGLGSLAVLIGAWAVLHHFFAGLRHLGFDLGWGEGKARARQTAWLALLLGLATAGLFALGMAHA